jgi:hypothetical protein
MADEASGHLWLNGLELASSFTWMSSEESPLHLTRKALSPDKANQKHNDDCADNRHEKSSGMKIRALSGPGEQPREQSAYNRPNDAQ